MRGKLTRRSGLAVVLLLGPHALIVASCGGTTQPKNGDGVPDSGTEAGTPNACGGSAALMYQGHVAAPADPCGPCLDGVIICAAPGILACVGPRPASFCPDASPADDAAVADDGSAGSRDSAIVGPFGDGATPTDATVDASRSLDATADVSSETSPPVDAGSDATVLDASPDVSVVDAAPDAPPFDGGPGWSSIDGGVTVTTFNDAGSPAVACLALQASDLVLDPVRTLLYASVTSTSPVFGNSVVRIDPVATAVTGTVFAGSNPDALSASDDGASLYVGLDGSDSVLRIDAATGFHDPPVYLGASQFFGARTAGEIRAVPGSSTEYVVSRRVSSVSPSFAGLALYGGATLLGEWNGFVGGESIAFVSPSELVGYNNDDTGFDLIDFNVTSTGFAQVSDTMSLISGFETTITAQGGWVFATNGQTVNGSNMQPVGQYAASGPVWPSPDQANVWFASGSTLIDFDRTTFVQSRSMTLPPGTGTPLSLVGWGTTTFAFRTSSSVCVATISP